MINLRCILFGHKFLERHIYKHGEKIVGTKFVSTDNCIYCGLTKEDCGIKLKNN